MYQKTILENGIRVITDTMPAVRSVAIGILVDAGPRDETPEQCGLAHMTEHLLFQGTSSRSAMQIARLMDAAGGHMGAFTARDYTCFHATVLDDYRTYAMDLLGDILLNSVFPADSLEREKETILRELESSRDAPDERVHTLLKATAWPAHPLGTPIISHPEAVKDITREDVIYFMHEHYVPNRMIMAAAGNIEHSDFVAQVQDAFWRMLGYKVPTIRTPPVYHAGVCIEPVPVSQAYFTLGLQAYPYAHPQRYGLHVLNNIIGGGISSRLFCRLREEHGLVYHISSDYHAYRDAGMLVIEGSTAPESLEQVLALTLLELWKVAAAAEPIDAEELWKAKMHLRGQHLIAAEDTHTRMSRLATQELYFGRHIAPEEILTQIEAIDGASLRRLAEEFLSQALAQVTAAIVAPEAAEHYRPASIEALIGSVREEMSAV